MKLDRQLVVDLIGERVDRGWILKVSKSIFSIFDQPPFEPKTKVPTSRLLTLSSFEFSCWSRFATKKNIQNKLIKFKDYDFFFIVFAVYQVVMVLMTQFLSFVFFIFIVLYDYDFCVLMTTPSSNNNVFNYISTLFLHLTTDSSTF